MTGQSTKDLGEMNREELKWVNPFEELPDKGEKVLVSLADGETHIAKLDRLQGGKHWWWIGKIMTDAVKAWMPLPKYAGK